MKQILLLSFLFLLLQRSFAQPTISFDTVVAGLNSPVDVTEVNDGSHRLFIVERLGTIRIWNGTRLLSTPFLNITSRVLSSYTEQGLLSLAFHPNYATNGYFYIYYNDTAGNVTIARYSRKNDSTANDTTGKIMLSIPKPFVNHNGGKLLFGPDGNLYFGTGDGGSGGDPFNNAQNLESLLGKMLRINVNNPSPPYYSIPTTNPYYGSTWIKQEIIDIGLRNPWRWSFDKQTGDMWIADVGQDEWEEVNVVKPANMLDNNFGWHCYEGTHVYSTTAACTTLVNHVPPIFEYPHNGTTGGYSITGGYVYRGTEYPWFQGYYIFVDFSSGHIWLTKPATGGTWNTTMLSNTFKHISSFGETSAGTLYATDFYGALLKVVAGAALPSKLVSFAGRRSGSMFELLWQVQSEERGDVYVVEVRTAQEGAFSEMTRVAASANNAANSYNFKLPAPVQKTYYRLKVVALNGAVYYSSVVTSEGQTKGQLKAYVSGRMCKATFPAGTTAIALYDGAGRLLTQLKLNGVSTEANIPLEANAQGVLILRALVKGEWEAVKVLDGY